MKAGTYNKQNLFKELGITDYQWKFRREEVLDALDECCVYEIQVGGICNQLIFTIKEVFDDFRPLPYKGDLTKRQKEKDYEKFVLRHLMYYPLNTISNVAEAAYKDEGLQKKYHHQLRIAEKYVRMIMQSNRVIAMKSQWSRKENGRYLPLNQQQTQYINECFSGYIKWGKESNLLSSLEAGDIEKEEVKEELLDILQARYDKVLLMFEQEFGFRPIKITYWEVNLLGVTENK